VGRWRNKDKERRQEEMELMSGKRICENRMNDRWNEGENHRMKLSKH